MKSNASELGFHELQAVGDACYYKYNQDSRYTNKILYECAAHFSSEKCKRGKNVQKPMPSFQVVVTTFKQDPINLETVENDVNNFIYNKQTKYSGFSDDMKKPLLG